MTRATRQLIRRGEILPSIQGGEGRAIRWSGNQAWLLVVTHPEPCQACAGYLGEVAATEDDLRQWGTRLLAVVADPEATTDVGVRLLGDGDRAARGRLGVGDDEAAVILADRWGEVTEVVAVGDDHGFPLPRRLVESAKILDVSCGECNVPGPEWGDGGADL